MADMSAVAEDLLKLPSLLGRTPPAVLLTRWAVLLGDDTPTYLDATCESGDQVQGSRYTLAAVTNRAICFLQASNPGSWWDYDRDHSRDHATVRDLVTWRRPLTCVKLAPRQPRVILRMKGADELMLPLANGNAYRPASDPLPLVRLVDDAWAGR
jgi:hypothetical protein